MGELITWTRGNGLRSSCTIYSEDVVTKGKKYGKWYIEFTKFDVYVGVGVKRGNKIHDKLYSYDRGASWTAHSSIVYINMDNIHKQGVNNPEWLLSTLPTRDTYGIAIDLDNNIISLINNKGDVQVHTISDSIINENNEDWYLFSCSTSSGDNYGFDTNFGVNPFKHFSQELKNEGYLPYDIDNAHIDNLPFKPNKYLFRKDNIIYQPTESGIEEIPNAILNKELFEQYGTEDISNIMGFDKEIREQGNSIEDEVGVFEYIDIVEASRFFRDYTLRKSR